MAQMFDTYDKALWEALVATVTADTAYTAYSTFCSVGSNSTGAMGAVPSATTAILMWVAFEARENKTWLLYGYTT